MGPFSWILDDPRKPSQATRIILCSGHVYFDLDAHRIKEKRNDLAIIRLEQLYPFDSEGLKKILASYGAFKECLWVQEEPKNMGAWPFFSSLLRSILPADVTFSYAGRGSSATPATGFYALHKQELANILQQVFKNEK